MPTWIRAGYWYVGSEFPVPDINSALFTHLTCAFAQIDSNTYELFLSSADEPYISTFTNIVKIKNPSVITLLSVWTGDKNSSALPSMVTQSSNRKSFITSSISIARKHEFHGLELYASAILSMGINMTSMETFLDEWRAAIYLEAKRTKQPQLILTMAGYYSPQQNSVSYPIDALRRNLDWIHIVAYDYHLSSNENFTAAHAALYDPSSQLNTDYGIKEWIKRGLPANQLVLGLPYHGYAWTLVNTEDNSIGSPARGRFTITAGMEDDKRDKQKRWMLIVWPTVTIIAFLLGFMLILRRRVFRLKVNQLLYRGKNSLSHNLQVFSFATIKGATDCFSVNNKIGEGGYGPVYKGKLQTGQEIAVKRLSHYSKQGLEEFENEVKLTAKLQHVNLVRLLGFCTSKEEKMLIYEYMPNKSLDFYLFEPIGRSMLEWEKWVQIIEGIIQGLLYLQEYSRLTIIHRDLKASNILLDADMRPKISDFGIARSFQKEENVGNTRRIVGTYGYVPPEYVKHGTYSRKYDVYSFGVILLQIISGKKCTRLYGPTKNLNLLEYAYNLWKFGQGIEFMDPSLDDATSTCKLFRCMQVALLCVQENWAQRPTMLEISSMLRNENEVIPNPERPAFSTNNNGEEKILSTQDIGSVDIATISQLVPR